MQLQFALVLVPLAVAALAAFTPDLGSTDPGRSGAARAGDAGSLDEVLVGDGAHRYRWDAAWPKLPEGMALGNTHGNVAVDRAGRIYFNTDSENAIIVVEPNGTFVRAMGAEWKGGLHGMTLVREGDEEFLYIAHLGRHCVAKLTLTGSVVWTVEWPEESGLYEKAGQFNPTAIAVRPDGGFYVADGYGRSWVHEYSAERKWLRAFGGLGEEPGRMRTPHGLLMDTAGAAPLLVVADRENHRLQRFSLTGELVDVIQADLRRPCSLARRGDLYAVADLTGRVTLIDAKQGELRAHLAEQPDPAKRAQNGIPRTDWRAGEFLSPHGVAFGLDGALYVQDWNALGRVTRLAPAQ
ncbi:MAG: peptidase [Planctomycetota bacterium]